MSDLRTGEPHTDFNSVSVRADTIIDLSSRKTYTEAEVKALIAAALREQISHANEWVSEIFEGDFVSLEDWLDARIPADAKSALDAYVADKVREAAERFANHPAIQMRRHVDMQGQWRWDVYRALIEEAPR